MNDTIRYVTHTGEEIVFGDENAAIKSIVAGHNFRDYSWDVSTSYNKITELSEDTVKSKKFAIQYCGDDTQADVNTVQDIFDIDVCAEEPGRIYIGDWYCEGFVTAASEKIANAKKRYEYTFQTDSPVWYKDVTYEKPAGTANLYFTIPGNRAIKTRTVITGPSKASNVYINFLNNTADTAESILFSASLAEGDVLTVDGRDLTCICVSSDGTETNWFPKRYYTAVRVFPDFEPGEYRMYFPDDGNAPKTVVTLYLERSTPE